MIVVVLCLVALFALYLYSVRTFNYWRVRGIKHDTPIPLFGNNAAGYLMRKSMTQIAEEVYWKYPSESVVGFFRSSKPELVIRDPNIIKRVLATDFMYFYPRGLNTHKTAVEPLLRNLFFADGDLWRLLRQRMTGAFSGSKTRGMFPLVIERAERLQRRTLAAANTGTPVDARDLMARYTTDFIGACGFGLDADSLNDETSPFRKLGNNIFHFGFIDAIIVALKEMFPNLFKNLKYLWRVENDLNKLVDSILEQRKYHASGRKDFIDLLIECKNKGVIKVESIEKVNSNGNPEIVSLEMTRELMAAQVFVFFAAGFETSSSATSYTLHQLAYHPEEQLRVQQEIDRVLAKYDNKLCYDAIKEMTYLECAFKEGMRLFPSLGFLIRECARPYTFPELNLHIDAGVGIVIPVQALHTDPQYFKHPMEFRPDRFQTDTHDTDKNKFVYLPFGDGPRACIGKRLGMMQSLAGLAAILSRCSVEPGPTTVRHPHVEPKAGIVQNIRGGLPLIFTPRTFND